MKTVQLRVHEGQLVGDAPASLREGSVVLAMIPDQGEEMSTSELEKLEANFDESWAQLEAGEEILAAAAILAVSAIR